MKSYADLWLGIQADYEMAQKALLGIPCAAVFEEAAKMVTKNALRHERLLIESRRATASGGRWVVQTQMRYIHLAEEAGCKVAYLSESQIKRMWKKLIRRTADIAVRL